MQNSKSQLYSGITLAICQEAARSRCLRAFADNHGYACLSAASNSVLQDIYLLQWSSA